MEVSFAVVSSKMAAGRHFVRTFGEKPRIVVKKGDPPLELPSFRIPTSTAEAWETVKSFGKSNSSVADPNAEVKVKRDPCAKEPAAALPIEVQISDPVEVVTNLHEQCHCPVGKCLHDTPTPALPGL